MNHSIAVFTKWYRVVQNLYNRIVKSKVDPAVLRSQNRPGPQFYQTGGGRSFAKILPNLPQIALAIVPVYTITPLSGFCGIFVTGTETLTHWGMYPHAGSQSMVPVGRNLDRWGANSHV
jgi:hypothetical protein